MHVVAGYMIQLISRLFFCVQRREEAEPGQSILLCTFVQRKENSILW